MQFSICEPYPLSGRIEYFEGYMMITTPRHIKRYDDVSGNFWIINNEEAASKPMDTLPYRKAAVSTFNNLVREYSKNHSIPSAEAFGTGLIYFKPENDNEYDDEHLNACVKAMSNFVFHFCKKYDTTALIASHFREKPIDGDENSHEYDLPHIHILFIKTDKMPNQLMQFQIDFDKYFD